MAISKPITRVEQYLAHISGMRVNVPEVPLTREEMYLAAWARKSGIEDTEMQGEPPLTLKDCIGEPFNGLVLYGKSTQVTTTGAQLLDIPDYTGISRGVTVTVKEGLISLHGTCTETGWILIERVTPVSLDGVYILSVYGADKRVTLATEKYSGIMASGSASTVNNSIAKRIAFSANKGEVLNVDGIKVMLNAGDTALPWEPYTGGKPSPSPDYPQEIQSAGDDGNLSVIVKILIMSRCNLCFSQHPMVFLVFQFLQMVIIRIPTVNNGSAMNLILNGECIVDGLSMQMLFSTKQLHLVRMVDIDIWQLILKICLGSIQNVCAILQRIPEMQPMEKKVFVQVVRIMH